MHFNTREAAIEYANKHGWKYELSAPTTNPAEAIDRYPMRTYADNFLPRVVSRVYCACFL